MFNVYMQYLNNIVRSLSSLSTLFHCRHNSFWNQNTWQCLVHISMDLSALRNKIDELFCILELASSWASSSGHNWFDGIPFINCTKETFTCFKRFWGHYGVTIVSVTLTHYRPIRRIKTNEFQIETWRLH